MSNPWRRVSGAVMAEMAIILPFLVLLVFGITELGRALYQENTLAKAVEAGGRYLGRIPDALDPHANCASVPDPEYGIPWDEAEANARKLIVYGDENAQPGDKPLLYGLEVNNVSISVAPATFTWVDSGGAESTSPDICVISIEAHAPFDSLFGVGRIAPMLNFDLTLRASTQERWIGE